MFQLSKSRFASLFGHLGLLCGAVCACLLAGLYIEHERQIDNAVGVRCHEGYGNTGLAIAVIAMCGLAFFAIIPNLLILIFSEDDRMMAQLVLGGFACAMIGISSILCGALLALMIEANKE
mmetsp:Transcript_17511/g.26053  ORF Transcript_17511/g.26053 Transcript_17511/m.26053 type:complete len:121 (-) Transcript_17511:417-779(-)